jgi:regulator of sigma E protease
VEEPLPLGPWRACVHGARKTAQWIRRFFSTLVGFVTQRVASRHLGGAITIGQVTYAAARYGVPKLIYFIGLISINLGLINLVPIPILDGGHLLFIGIEKARGRPVNDRIQSVATYMGMAIILSLILFSTWNDLWRLFGSG